MPRLAAHHLSAFDEAAGWFYFNFKHELHPYWSWQTAWRRGWLPLNLSHVKPMYLNVCRTENEGNPNAQHPGGANSDLPWYNALPSARSSSPVVLLMGLGLGTLIGAAVLLKMVLNVLERSSYRSKAAMGLQPINSLELPPRLLNLARKTQGRKPGGLGVLGLKQRVSSRALTQLAFPLMSQEHTIQETDEELLESPQAPGSDLFASSARGAGSSRDPLNFIR